MASGGTFNIDDWSVIANPDSIITMSIITDAVDLIKAVKANDDVTYINKIDLDFEVRPCLIGEITLGNACEICPPKTYSLDPDQAECSTCPDGAI